MTTPLQWLLGVACMWVAGRYTVTDAAAWQVAPSAPAGMGFDKSEFQARSALLVNLVNSLRAHGAQDITQAPTIVVCGDQSSGKSSIIQRICGVELPRNTGTCTRCPMEVRLLKATAIDTGVAASGPSNGSSSTSENGEWSCRLKLHREYDAKGSRLPWNVEEFFGPLITRKQDVEAWVRRAQHAILNPGKPASAFLEDSFTGANEVQFSKNRVVLEVRGAPVDLTLVDLPGIIHSTAQGEDYAELTQQLTSDYMSRPESIIVMAVSANNDLENQKVYNLAQKADPQLQRTMGVLTKLDVIETGTHARWQDVLQGREYQLKLGWYAVRNPTKSEREANVMHEAVGEAEQQFFLRTAPWSGLPTGDRNRLGLDAVMQAMSSELTRHTELYLLNMKSTVEKLYNEELATLSALPTEVSAPERQWLLIQMVHDLSLNITHAFATSEDKAFQQQLLGTFAAFKAGVLTARPRFEVKPGHVFDFAEYSGEVGANHRSRAEATKCPAGKPGSCASVGRSMSLAKIKDIIDLEAGHAHVIDVQPFKAIARVLHFFQEGWTQPSLNCLTFVTSLLSDYAAEKASHHLGRFAPLETLIRGYIRDYVNNESAIASKNLKDLLEMEAEEPFTINDQYLRDSIAQMQTALSKWLLPLQPTLRPSNLGADQKVKLTASVSAGISDLGYDKPSPAQLEEWLLLRGTQSSESKLMVSVMAYYKVSSTRFQDAVPMALHHLLRRVARGLKNHILGELRKLEADAIGQATGVEPGGDGSESGATNGSGAAISSAVDLMVEDSGRVGHRAASQARLQDLKKIRSMLSHF